MNRTDPSFPTCSVQACCVARGPSSPHCNRTHKVKPTHVASWDEKMWPEKTDETTKSLRKEYGKLMMIFQSSPLFDSVRLLLSIYITT